MASQLENLPARPQKVEWVTPGLVWIFCIPVHYITLCHWTVWLAGMNMLRMMYIYWYTLHVN